MRDPFGVWGSALDDDGFAAALAAIGVLGDRFALATPDEVAERLRRALAPPDGAPFGPPRAWRLPRGLKDGRWRSDAETLSSGWSRFRSGLPADAFVRLWVTAWTHLHPFRLVFELSRPALGWTAVALIDRRMNADADWRWPLRVAVGPGARPQDVVGALRTSYWHEKLFDAFELSPTAEFCDLLLATGALEDLGPAMRTADIRADANCVVAMGLPDESPRRSLALARSAAERTHASGVVFMDPPADPGRWFHSVVEDLSHDRPLDVALRVGSPYDPPPILIAHPRMLEATRVSARVDVLRSRLAVVRATDLAAEVDVLEDVRLEVEADAAPAGAELEAHGAPDEGGERTFGPRRGRPRQTEERVLGMRRRSEELAVLAGETASRPPPEAYMHESGAASWAAEIARRAEPLLAEAGLTQDAMTREIQARVSERTSEGERRPLRGGLIAGASHEVEVGIATPREGWAAAGTAFPTEELPPSEEPHELTVVLWEPVLVPTPLPGVIQLPRTGASTTVAFDLGSVPETLGGIRARITVLFRNRVLQTAILTAPVVRDRALALDGPDAIRVEVEAAIRPGLADLGSRRHFDAALLFNHTSTGEPAMQSFTSMNVDATVLVGLDSVVDRFQDEISAAADDPDGYAELDSAKALALLVRLGRHGSILRDGLFPDPRRLDAFRSAERIQVVSVNPERLVPLELVYDRPSPAEGATLCPNAAARLGSGEPCGVGCPGGDQPAHPHVCPLGFWCTSKAIERRAADRPDDPLEGARIECEATTARSDLRPFGAGAFGASSRVSAFQPGAGERVLAALTSATQGHGGSAETWQGWRDLVGSLEPGLLLLLPHTGVDPAGIGTLEIGDEAVAVDQLSRAFVSASQDGEAPPLVVLLGCSTALSQMPFQSLVIKFHRLGAAAVVGTIATILGRHAAPVAEQLVRALREVSARRPATLAEVMRDVRREMLGKGVVMTLALTAFGDADWRFVPTAP